MRLEKRRVVYGSVIGAATFALGILAIWATVPVDTVDNLSEWRAALWVFLDANGVVLEPGAANSPLLTQTAPGLPTLEVGYVFPFLLLVIGTILTVSGVSGTGRYQYMVENGAPILYGYLGVGIVAVMQSGARPALAGFTGIIFILVLAIFVGSRVVGVLTGGLPFIGVASLGLVMVLGLVFIVAGVALISALLPMILVSVGGMVTGVTLIWAVREAPR
ncbi:hypothetical protein [Halovenus sp. HT40]|uniref:hypothetical protein n=1 Tax=Halovenus sp. HT40 TaxID=3126691 RepID=UPI00300EA638